MPGFGTDPLDCSGQALTIAGQAGEGSYPNLLDPPKSEEVVSNRKAKYLVGEGSLHLGLH